MKKKGCLIFLALCLTFLVNSQENETFEINERIIKFNSKEYEEKNISDYRNLLERKNFYEDENYAVTYSCNGEWGGSVWFTNKNTNIEYSCAATCVKSVIKIKDEYFVTTSLAHMGSGSSIFKITEPDSMSIFDRSKVKPKEYYKGLPVYMAGSLNNKSHQGRKSLWSEWGVYILLSFQYKDKLYSIVEKKNNISLMVLNDKKLEKLVKISDNSVWSQFDLIQINDSHILLFLGKPSLIHGYIEIIDNKIDLVRYSKPKKNESQE